MILRLLRASFAPADGPAIIAALRAEADAVRDWPGMITWTHGLRREGGLLRGITISAWTDFDAVVRIAGGRPDRDVSQVWRTGALRDVVADHYELTEPASPASPILEGEALGVVWGTIRPNVEGAVHDMIRSIRPAVMAAGVTSLCVARRIVEQRTEIVVVAPWRDRLSLHEFAQTRSTGAIDPAFSSQLEDFRFETYDTLPADRLGALPPGPAVLTLDDDGRCVDATPGVEAVLGVPGELLLGNAIRTLAVGAGVDELLAAMTAGQPAQADLTIRSHPGLAVTVSATVEPASPRPGLHALSLEPIRDREDGALPAAAES
jgi:PAS domain-containing protein